ncbi:hypothetical protein TIFTF001_002028 [Ficus carica]|uniref:Uncharacterized protein n=1 Tax=Ficus carica TaxID=3494 RepID=A0AA87ZBC9_FICCA|nr:hypothetical protein TIFTF001_002028 [Ficus carica]
MTSLWIMVSYEGEWIKSPETGTFRFDGSKAKGISVLENITYIELLDKAFAIAMSMKMMTSAPHLQDELLKMCQLSLKLTQDSPKALVTLLLLIPSLLLLALLSPKIHANQSSG